eukprot:1184559-Prorocentrum_minimum.AAC.6
MLSLSSLILISHLSHACRSSQVLAECGAPRHRFAGSPRPADLQEPARCSSDANRSELSAPCPEVNNSELSAPCPRRLVARLRRTRPATAAHPLGPTMLMSTTQTLEKEPPVVKVSSSTSLKSPSASRQAMKTLLRVCPKSAAGPLLV